MKVFFTLLAICLCLSLTLCDDKLPVIDVYVESLCPDCMDFIGGSFKNFFLNNDHSNLAQVNFYPYGNANEKFDGKKYVFTCQHGDNECYGNVVETCLMNKFDVNGGHAMLICIEGNIRNFDKDFDKTLEHCLPDPDIRNEIITCAKGDEGNKLQHEVAQKTPKHNYVPWVEFNGEHDKEKEDQIVANMLKYLCDISGQQIEGCQDVLSMMSFNSIRDKTCHNTWGAHLENVEDYHIHVTETLKFLEQH